MALVLINPRRRTGPGYRVTRNRGQIGGIRGHFFPNSGISLSRRVETFSASLTGRPQDLPSIRVTPHFHNPRGKPIMHATVTIRNQVYLIAGLYDRTQDINASLRGLDPSVQWRGAIAVFSVGLRVTLLSRPRGRLDYVYEAVRLYMQRVKQALDMELDVPTTLTANV